MEREVFAKIATYKIKELAKLAGAEIVGGTNHPYDLPWFTLNSVDLSFLPDGYQYKRMTVDVRLGQELMKYLIPSSYSSGDTDVSITFSLDRMSDSILKDIMRRFMPNALSLVARLKERQATDVARMSLQQHRATLLHQLMPDLIPNYHSPHEPKFHYFDQAKGLSLDLSISPGGDVHIRGHMTMEIAEPLLKLIADKIK